MNTATPYGVPCGGSIAMILVVIPHEGYEYQKKNRGSLNFVSESKKELWEIYGCIFSSQRNIRKDPRCHDLHGDCCHQHTQYLAHDIGNNISKDALDGF